MADSAIPPEAPERWLPVVGWEGLYEVSDLGRVRSLPRMTVSGIRGGRTLTPAIGAWYLVVTLWRNNRGRTQLVHRLVLESFIGPCPDGLEALHGRGGALDNRLANLRWDTKAENELDKIRHDTLPYGDRCTHAILTAQIVAECRRRHASGETQVALAREFGVHRITMHDAIVGRTWRRVA